MQITIVYSSRTGNTKQVAEAIHEAVPQASCFSIESAPAPSSLAEGSLLILGYWVDKGTLDDPAKRYLTGAQHIKVALFGTMGADPTSEHAKVVEDAVRATVPNSCECLLSFICQGKIDPRLVEKMKTAKYGFVVPDSVVSMAATHPDKEDLLRAQKIFKELVQNIA